MAASSFSVAQKAVLPLAALPCLVLGILCYKYAMRHLRGEEKFHKNVSWIYAMVAGATLGRALFHSFASAAIAHYGLVGVTFLVGIALMDLVFGRRSRVAHDNPHMVTPDIGTIGNEDLLMDRKTLLSNSHLEYTDPAQAGVNYMDGRDLEAVRKTRRHICYVALLVTHFSCVLEGITLVYCQVVSYVDTGGLVAVTYIDKLLASIVIYGSMLFCELPGRECNRLWHYVLHYWVITFTWTLTVALSALPVLLDMPYLSAYAVMNHLALALVYGFAAGLLLWTAMLFMRLDSASTMSAKGRTRARQQYAYWALCFGTAGACAVTGIFV